MRKLLPFVLLFATVSSSVEAMAQNDSASLLNELSGMAPEMANLPVTGTFKGTYILNTASIESPAKGVLQVMIMHRFGKLSDGAYDLFGLDNATIRLGLDYGITDRLMVGIGRSSFEKNFDGSLKYKILRQTTDNKYPLSISLNTGLTYTTLRYADQPYLDATYRTKYFTQLMLAKKFSTAFSLQVTPSWLHYNLVPEAVDKNNIFVLGAGGRIKLTKRLSINGEYNYLFPNQVVSKEVYNSLSAGLDIETGGHVFQFIFTNSRGLVPPVFLANTTDSWGKGGIYFGFNISRVFNTGQAKSIPK
ncbi:DUF5777 family beta-barrel protein [Flavihumibacter profundi]|uniref:DUF5777 family beta-barrel protein n=1 Tax=Flavihumibacter profundi TaxID=2716883 RepID=UPI001CC80F66|nr:DUF5777 family beta-barrel protein [Flavihumibacter profundi]MBZ5856771.1 DUF5777 family beta-barrel protein [Flavihumibacter profundi]